MATTLEVPEELEANQEQQSEGQQDQQQEQASAEENAAELTPADHMAAEEARADIDDALDAGAAGIAAASAEEAASEAAATAQPADQQGQQPAEQGKPRPSRSQSFSPLLSPEAARLKEIRRKREEVRSAKYRFEELKAEAKEAKKEWESMVDELTRLIDRELEVYPLFDQKAQAGESITEGTAGNADSAAAPAAEQEQPQQSQPSDAWRSTPISALDLKGKLLDRLEEAGISTVGQLEDLRAGAGLMSIKGVGRKKADDLEEMVLSWLSRNRDAQALAEAKAGASESEKGDSFVAEAIAAIQARAKDLNTGEPNCLDRKHDEKVWQSGYEAFGRGVELGDCAYLPGEDQDDWIRGWLSARLLESYEPSDEAEAEDQADDNGSSADNDEEDFLS